MADSTVKLPDICPEPPMIGSRMTGAVITSSSSLIATGGPTPSVVAVRICVSPEVLNLKLTTGSLCADRNRVARR